MTTVGMIMYVFFIIGSWLGFGWLCNAIFNVAFITKYHDTMERRNYWYYILCGPTSFIQLAIYRFLELAIKDKNYE